MRLECTVSDLSGAEIMKEKSVLHQGKNLETISLPDDSKEDVLIQWDISRIDSAKTVAAGTLTLHRPESPVRFHNRLPVVKGKEIFPLGIYLPWPNERDGKIIELQSAEQSLKDLPLLADTGFNLVVVPYPKFYAAKCEKIMELANRLNMLAVCSAEPSLYREIGKKFPNVIAWVGPDEPEINPDKANHTPEKLRKDYEDRKVICNDRPIVMNHSRPVAFGSYAGCRDILMSDPYTFGKVYSDAGRISHFIREMRNQTGNAVPNWVVLQLYKIKDDMYLPSPQQMRCQTFMALMLGADGIFYYSTATPETPGWHLLTDPESAATWKSIKPLFEEVRRRLTLFRNPAIAQSKPDDAIEKAGLLWRVGIAEGKKILTIINYTGREVKYKFRPEGFIPPEKIPPYAVIFMEKPTPKVR